MSAVWDGLPQNPEQSGWHWLAGPNGVPACFHWNADRRTWWIPGPDECSADAASRYATYLGPCLTPADNTRLTARVAKLEAALRWSYANKRASGAQELMARAYNAEPQTLRTKAEVERLEAEMQAWDRIAEANQDGEETWRAEVRAALTPEPR